MLVRAFLQYLRTHFDARKLPVFEKLMELGTFSPQQECPEVAKSGNVIQRRSTRKRPASKFLPIRCLICRAHRMQNELRNVRVWSDKLIVLMACLNRNEIDIDTARHLSASPVVFYVCCTHLINSCDELFAMLDAKSPFDIPNSDRLLVEKAMEIMDSFKTGLECLPIVNNWHFLQICYSFLVKHWHDVANVPLPVNATVKHVYPRRPAPINQNKYRCRICDQVKHPQSVKHMKNRVEKLLVLISAIHRRDISVAIANQLFGLSSVLTCRSHLPEACNHLVVILNVTAPCVIPIAGQSEVKDLMWLIDRISEGTEVIAEDMFLQHSMDVCQNYWTGIPKKKLIESIPSTSFDQTGEIIRSDDIKVEHEEVVETVEEGQSEKISILPKSYSLYSVCMICEKRNDSVQFVTLRADKLLVLLVSIHRKEISKDAAKVYFQLPTLFICHHHFIDSGQDLFEMLAVSDPNELESTGDKKEVIQTLALANFVQSAKIPLTEPSFVQICRQFLEKHGGERAIESLRKTDEPIQSCRLCGTIRRESDVRCLTVLSEKMIVLVTEVSRGGMTKSLACQYFNQLKELLVCQWHLVDVCKKLCTMFRVARPEAFMNPTKHLVDHAMGLVGDIQKGRFPFATTDGKHFVQQCQRFTNKYWKPKHFNYQ